MLAGNLHANTLRDLRGWRRRARFRLGFCSKSRSRRAHAPRVECQRSRSIDTYVANTLAPNRLVKLHVDAHVGRLHRLLRKLLNLCVAPRDACSRSVFVLASSCVVTPPSRARARIDANEINVHIIHRVSRTSPSSRARSIHPHARFAIASFRAQRALARDRSLLPRGRNTYRRHGARGALLESDTRDRLAEVDGVLSGDHIGGLSVASHGLESVASCRGGVSGTSSRGLSSSECWIGHLDRRSQYCISHLTICRL